MDLYLEYTENKPIPLIFRKFSAISCLSAVLERRVWFTNAEGPVYPNLFILLIAPSGTGKGGSIKATINILRKLNELKPECKITISPKNFTKASMLDIMEQNQKSITWPQSTKLPPLTYTSFYVAIEELGTLINSYDKEMISFFTDLWNCDDIVKETRRQAKSTELINPQLGGLCGTQPKFISSVFPEESWEQGFTARIIMVYCGETPYWDPWEERCNDEKLEKKLVNHLSKLQNEMGEINVSREFKLLSKQWRDDGCQPVPTHPKLQTYTVRRWQMSLKLAIISAANRGDVKNIIEEDFHISKQWLLDAEALSDDIFKHFNKKSDRDVLQELNAFLWKRYALTNNLIQEREIYQWLSDKVSSEKVEKLMDLAVKTGCILSAGGVLYKPGSIK